MAVWGMVIVEVSATEPDHAISMGVGIPIIGSRMNNHLRILSSHGFQ